MNNLSVLDCIARRCLLMNSALLSANLIALCVRNSPHLSDDFHSHVQNVSWFVPPLSHLTEGKRRFEDLRVDGRIIQTWTLKR
jgi:hypothetical protein